MHFILRTISLHSALIISATALLFTTPALAWSIEQLPRSASFRPIYQNSGGVAPDGNDDEDAWFDRKHDSIGNVASKLYHQGRVLFFGSANHNNYAVYQNILDTLALVGEDPDLKFVALETYADAAPFYELLSTQSLEKAITLLPNDQAVRRTLCDTSEWAYVISKFMPKIRELNARRPKDNPVIVTAIDSMSNGRSFLFPARDEDPHFDSGKYIASQKMEFRDDCLESKVDEIWPLWVVSRNRELETAKNFARFTRRLGARGKALVRYHHAHLIRKSLSCSPEWIGENQWIAKRGPLTWLQIYEQMAQQGGMPLPAQSLKTLLIDEVDDDYNTQGVTQLASRQAGRYPNQDFALEFGSDIPKSIETGSALFRLGSKLTSYNQIDHGSARLNELFDGLIYNAGAERTAALGLEAAMYLPAHCQAVVKP